MSLTEYYYMIEHLSPQCSNIPFHEWILPWASVCSAIRAIRTEQFLYIQNLAPDRWPVGDPDCPVWPDDEPTGGFGDCDGSPTKTFLCNHRQDQAYYFDLAFGKHPAEELYDVKKDPYQLRNLANQNQYGKSAHRISRLLKRLRKHGLIKKIANTYKYYLTALGRKVTATALKLREMYIIPSLKAAIVG